MARGDQDWANLALAAIGGGALVSVAARFRNGVWWWDRQTTTAAVGRRPVRQMAPPVRRPVRQIQEAIPQAAQAQRALPAPDRFMAQQRGLVADRKRFFDRVEETSTITDAEFKRSEPLLI